MMRAIQHFGSISGGKDSQAVLCKMVERIERGGLAAFGNRAPHFLAAGDAVVPQIPEAALNMVLGACPFGAPNDWDAP